MADEYGLRRMGLDILLWMIAFGASVVGGVCGIGGGVLMKPLLDLFKLADASTASLLSGCTVFVMSLYNVGKSFRERTGVIAVKTTLPLAVGAAIGGIAGKQAFSTLCRMSSVRAAGMAQSLCLLALTAGTLIYTIKRDTIHTRRVTEPGACVVIGVLLGMLSSFLGIGGGPFNIAVLHYFFGMDTKPAVANSLFIILLSQAASLASTLLSRTAIAVRPISLLLMVLGGITGGMVGRRLNKKLSEKRINTLFMGLMAAIICICAYNALRYAA